MKNPVVFVFALAILSGSASGLASAKLRAAEDQDGACSLHSIFGAYGFVIRGFVGKPPVTGSAIALAGVARTTYDGEGHLATSDSTSVAGIATNGGVFYPGHGTYAVATDCTGTYSISYPKPGGGEYQPSVSGNFVIVDNGRGLQAVSTSPGASISAEGVRL
ncbi:MAG: hypothetical protein NVSMB64_28010 [Candidatus Velthaea sp.]